MKSRSTPRDFFQRAEVFKALGHPDLLRIVDKLESAEYCVCELVEAVGSSWSTVSRHLSVLKAAGILADEKRGLQVFYRIELPCVRGLRRCLETDEHGETVQARTTCGCGE